MDKSKRIWEEEIYFNFKFNQFTKEIFTFEAKETMAALYFANPNEASAFDKAIKKRMETMKLMESGKRRKIPVIGKMIIKHDQKTYDKEQGENEAQKTRKRDKLKNMGKKILHKDKNSPKTESGNTGDVGGIQIDQNLRELFEASNIYFDSLDAKEQKELMAWAGKRKNQRKLRQLYEGKIFNVKVIQFL